MDAHAQWKGKRLLAVVSPPLYHSNQPGETAGCRAHMYSGTLITQTWTTRTPC